MIVEYLGIPGSGKTYQSNLYKKQLDEKGIRYIDVSRFKGAPLYLKLLFFISEHFIFCLSKYRDLYKRLSVCCASSTDVTPKYLDTSIEYCIKRIIGCIYLQDLFGKGKKVAINDEGLLQWIVFLNVQYNVKVDNIIDVILPFNQNLRTIYMDTPIESAIENIKKRNRHVCPMDEMSDLELQNYLSESADASDYLCHKLNICANKNQLKDESITHKQFPLQERW